MTEKLTKEYGYLWDHRTPEEISQADLFAEDYRVFMSRAKTERECVRDFIQLAEKNGYQELGALIRSGASLKAGDRVYAQNMDKNVAFFLIGEQGFQSGMNLLGAHLDSPRLDLKQNPLYEDAGFGLLKTHYYGAIKKYQWVTLPLAIHGVIVKKDGTKIDVNIGEEKSDPIFGISDLLYHLAGDQMGKTAGKAIEGEDLNVLVGCVPIEGVDEKERVKKNILRLLNEKYGITEEDFVSSELELVPAGEARDYGLDRGMIWAYGQDDRVCAYTSFRALMELSTSEKTCVCFLVDKEEIGNNGATGSHSAFFENTVAEVMALCGEYSELALRRTLAGSRMLSSDVSAAFDPNYPSVSEKANTAFFGKGIVFNKYTGSGGKYSCNDANPEYLAKLRGILDRNQILWQTAELGKVDQGGGATIAWIMAKYNMEVVDCGVPVLSMHAPWEITCKLDIFETMRAYRAFLIEA